eukprot:m.330366 g.330366  ORF g.330366 m.330366 type:complete len:66 (+) comp19761_c0_seq5:3-200(+)
MLGTYETVRWPGAKSHGTARGFFSPLPPTCTNAAEAGVLFAVVRGNTRKEMAETLSCHSGHSGRS